MAFKDVLSFLSHFLDGFSLRLRQLHLVNGIQYSGTTDPHLSPGTNLVTLRLGRSPSSGYIAPKEMVTGTYLSTLTRFGEVAPGVRRPSFPR